MIAEILRLIARGEMVAGGENEIAVGRLHDAATEMISVRERSVLLENDRDVVQPGCARVDQPGARQRGARTWSHGLGIAKIDRLVLPIAAVDDDVVQAALA